jgi:outer membrane protein OmpA-like peptidoglycan-associated protein
MRKNILVIFLLISFKLFSQTNPVLFLDEFDNNNNDWLTSSASYGYNANISNGKYNIKTKNFSQRFDIPTTISSTKDYSFEVPFQIDGSFSFLEIFFRNYDKGKLRFTINNASGFYSYSVSSFDGKTNSYMVQNKPVPKTAASKKNVLMKIEQKGIQTSFYINDILLETINNVRIPGNKLGFEIGYNMKVSIERFSVLQNNNGINLTKLSNQKLKRERLGSSVNSTGPELGPIVTADGQYLYFNRRDYFDKPKAVNNECDEIWYSKLQPDSSWGNAKKHGYPINDDLNNDIISISPDNNTIFMSDKVCGPTPEIKFWVANRTKTGWNTPKSMNVINGYNLDEYTEATMSSDGSAIIIALRRNDTEGEKDLHVCFLGSDSVWSEPKNLGKVVNTLGSDFAPFLAADNVTLYYSTDGFQGYGGKDIYISRRLDDTWTNWSEPENLGPNINSIYWDAYYSVNASGTYAYMNSSTRDSTGSDIYQIKLTNNKPKPVVIVQGKVLDGKTKLPIEAVINYEILPEGKAVGLARSNPATGEYKIVLPYGKTYGYRAETKGYIPVNENFDLVEEKQYVEITKDLYLIPIEVGQTIKLNNVFFVQSKAELLTSSYPELDRLIKIMKNNPTMVIELHGYTDNSGDPKKNIELSEQRVITVKNYLISKGISAKLVQGKGFGGANPIADNGKEETRRLNRRVEFVILKK